MRWCSTSTCASPPGPGVQLDDVKEILSIPVATAQCHRFLRERLPDAERAQRAVDGAARPSS